MRGCCQGGARAVGSGEPIGAPTSGCDLQGAAACTRSPRAQVCWAHCSMVAELWLVGFCQKCR